MTKVSEGTPKDVDRAVAAAQKAFDTVWGLNCPGNQRGSLLNKLADIMESRFDELCAVEALDNGSWLSLSYLIQSGPSLTTPALNGTTNRQDLPMGQRCRRYVFHFHPQVLCWLGRQNPRPDHRD